MTGEHRERLSNFVEGCSSDLIRGLELEIEREDFSYVFINHFEEAMDNRLGKVCQGSRILSIRKCSGEQWETPDRYEHSERFGSQMTAAV